MNKICIKCNELKEHHAKGLCENCYSLKRYYNNRKKILKQQTKRWSKRFKEDKEFREKRYIRDKTRRISGSLKGKECKKCGIKNDLHRHHPNINDYTNFIILCRKCHNILHFGKSFLYCFLI